MPSPHLLHVLSNLNHFSVRYVREVRHQDQEQLWVESCMAGLDPSSFHPITWYCSVVLSSKLWCTWINGKIGWSLICVDSGLAYRMHSLSMGFRNSSQMTRRGWTDDMHPAFFIKLVVPYLCLLLCRLPIRWSCPFASSAGNTCYTIQ